MSLATSPGQPERAALWQSLIVSCIRNELEQRITPPSEPRLSRALNTTSCTSTLADQAEATSDRSARIALVVAVARNGVIGRDGCLPWRMPSDLKMFRRLTMGTPMIMGRRTFASLARPLDGRDNLVVTRDPAFAAPGIEVFGGLDDALARARVCVRERGCSEITVIGGAELYRTALPIADRLYWTSIEADVTGDTMFPAFDRSDWREIGREPIAQGPRDEHPATLITLDRIGPGCR